MRVCVGLDRAWLCHEVGVVAEVLVPAAVRAAVVVLTVASRPTRKTPCTVIDVRISLVLSR
jgi:hypothetical protein